MCKDIELLLLPLMECLSQKNITLQVSCVKCGCDPWQTRRASQGKPSGNRDTLQEAREQWEQPGWGGGGGGTPAESGASTPQSVMETDPLISVNY